MDSCNFKLSKNSNDDELDFVDLTNNYSDSDDGMIIVELFSSDTDDVEDKICDRRQRMLNNNYRNRSKQKEYKESNKCVKRSYNKIYNSETLYSKICNDKCNVQNGHFKSFKNGQNKINPNFRKIGKNVKILCSSNSDLDSDGSHIDLCCDDSSNDVGNNKIQTNLLDKCKNDSSKKYFRNKRYSKKSSIRAPKDKIGIVSIDSDNIITRRCSKEAIDCEINIISENQNSTSGYENSITSDSENNTSDYENYDFKNSKTFGALNITPNHDNSILDYENRIRPSSPNNISDYDNGVTLDCEISIPSKNSDISLTSNIENSIYISGATMAAIQGAISFRDYMSNSDIYISQDFMDSLHNIESLPGFTTFMSSVKVTLQRLSSNEIMAYQYLNRSFTRGKSELDESFERPGVNCFTKSELNTSNKKVECEKKTGTQSNNTHKSSRTNPIKNKNNNKDKIISDKKFQNCSVATEEFQASFNGGSMMFSCNESNKTDFKRDKKKSNRSLRSNTILPDEEAPSGYSTSSSDESIYERINDKVNENQLNGDSLPEELLNCGECGISISSLQHLDRHLERCRGMKRKKALKDSQRKKTKIPNDSIDFIPGKLYVVDTDDGEIIEGWSAPMGFVPPGPVCPRCAFDVPTLYDLPLHQKHHLGNEEVTCPICTFSTSSIPIYLLHVEDHAS